MSEPRAKSASGPSRQDIELRLRKTVTDSKLSNIELAPLASVGRLIKSECGADLSDSAY